MSIAVAAEAHAVTLPGIWEDLQRHPRNSPPPEADSVLKVLWLAMIVQGEIGEGAPRETASFLELYRHSGLKFLVDVELERLDKRKEGSSQFVWPEECKGKDAHSLAPDPVRIAAAYHLWPWFAAELYHDFGERLKGNRHSERKRNAHIHLRAIQLYLYSNVRATLDAVRSWFSASADQETSAYVGSQRHTWRSERLTSNTAHPEFAAIDSLAAEMVRMEQSAPRLREAIHVLQALAVEPRGSSTRRWMHSSATNADLCTILREAVQMLGVAQITLFGCQDPSLVPVRAGKGRTVPLNELALLLGRQPLVESSASELPVLRDLLPFDLPGPTPDDHWQPDADADHFRRLADAIYTSSTTQSSFAEQRDDTVKDLEYTRLFSSGRLTSAALYKDTPPAGNWFAKSLREAALEQSIPDWSDPSWWTALPDAERWGRIFPSPPGTPLWMNPHVTAFHDYWLYHGEWLDQSELQDPSRMKERAKTDTVRLGHLLDLILRRDERFARTSFFFALARTHVQGGEQNVLVQFAGGTFANIERPGVPFEAARLHELCNRVRPIIMALGHYATTRLERLRYLEDRAYKTAAQRVVDLAVGSHANKVLPFSKDHALSVLDPTRSAIAEAFFPHWATSDWKTKRSPIDRTCDRTFKSLFCWTIEREGALTAESLRSNPLQMAECLSTHEILCSQCFRQVLDYLLNSGGGPCPPIVIDVEIPADGILLPSRPGIRFVLALCDLVRTIHWNRSLGSAVERLEVGRTRPDLAYARIHLTTPVVQAGFRIPPTERPGDLFNSFQRFLRGVPPIEAPDSADHPLCAPHFWCGAVLIPIKGTKYLDVLWMCTDPSQ